MTKGRHDQGKTFEKFQFASQKGTGANSHDRQHVKSKAVHKEYVVIERMPETQPVVARVDDNSVASIMLTIGMLAIIFIRKFN